MKALEKFWYTPPHQRRAKGKEKAPEKVEFELRPLDQRTLYVVQTDMNGSLVGADGALAAFEYSVVGWKGLDVEFSEQAKRVILNGPGELHWTMWFAQIAGTLYKRALLGDPEAKNS